MMSVRIRVKLINEQFIRTLFTDKSMRILIRTTGIAPVLFELILTSISTSLNIRDLLSFYILSRNAFFDQRGRYILSYILTINGILK